MAANTNNYKFKYTTAQIRDALPTYNLRKWNVSDPTTEVNWPNQPVWGVPAGMTGKIKIGGCCHNGWNTFRKTLLEQVPYPTALRRGQDSLWNWRILKSERNLNFMLVDLGVYRQTKNLKEARPLFEDELIKWAD